MNSFNYYRQKLFGRCPIPPVIQFSPPRSGSTLLWNILRTAYPDKQILKWHNFGDYQPAIHSKSKIVATVRNPLDAVSSSLQRYDLKATLESIESQLDEFEMNGIRDLISLKSNPQAMILRYEDFAFNWDYAFDEIEIFFKKEIPFVIRQGCMDQYSIDAAKKKSDLLGDFSNYDSIDLIHGKHVSKYCGRVGYYAEFLNEEMINAIYDRFSTVFNEFDYGK